MISILIVVITAITFGLGSLMYYTNLKSTRQNVIGAELADFIYNTNYSMRFGKQIDTFYGMDDQLLSLRENYDLIHDLYIVGEDDGILYSTSKEMLDSKVCALESGKNAVSKKSLYCMYELNDSARILVRTDRKSITADLMEHMKAMALRAVIGAAIAIALILIFSFVIKKEKVNTVVSSILLIIWIITFGVMIGRNGYLAYRRSLDTVFETVRYEISADFDKVRSLGVAEEDIIGVDQYLERYSDMIPEIDRVKADGGEISFVKSASQERKILLDYIFQSALLLLFSLIIVIEQQIYSKDKRLSEEAANNGTS